jgi:hypothetical protein
MKTRGIFKVTATLWVALTICGPSWAQSREFYVVRAGRNPSWSIPDSAEFKFAQFTSGYIVLKDDKRTEDMSMNFNQLFVSPVMIKAPGDTVMIGSDIVKSVWIGKSNFVFIRDKYYELLTFAEPVKLAKQHFLRLFRTELVDSHGGVSTARTSQAIRGRRPPGTPTLLNEISANTQNSFKFQTDFYFIGPDGEAESAKKSSLLKHYKSKKDRIDTYIKDQKIDFKSESDLLKLMEFCQSN